MDTHFMNLVTRVLCFQDRSLTERVSVVGIVLCIEIPLDGLYRHTAVLGESDIVGTLFKIVFGVTLCTNQRSHLLM